MGNAGCVLYCHCARANVVPPEVRKAVLERLSAAGVAFDAVHDLCEMSARKDPALKRFAESGDVRIAACFPRAVRWLFHAGGAPLPAEGVEVMNMRAQPVEDVVSRLLADVTPQADRSAVWNLAHQEAGGAVEGMNKLTGASLRVVLYEGADSEPFGDDERFDLLESLLEAGYEVTRMGNCEAGLASQLAGRAARIGPAGSDASPGRAFPVPPPERSSTCLVLGRFNGFEPFAIEGIAAPGHGRGETEFHVSDITGLDTDGVLAVAERVTEESGARGLGRWKPWFPVIDYDRCTNCMQCLSFCLFDVFIAGGQGRIVVDNPDKCKPNCPACARVCPEVAIMFPLCSMGPINGDEVRDRDLDCAAIKVDVSALLGGDPRSSLGARTGASGKRFSIERRGARALLERKQWLEPGRDHLPFASHSDVQGKEASPKMQGGPVIPDEAAGSLPAGSAAEGALERMQARSATIRTRSPDADERPEPPSEEEWGI